MEKKWIIALILFNFISLFFFVGCPRSQTQSSPSQTSIKELDRAKITAITVALKRDKELSGENIRVNVTNLEATLYGNVENEEQKARAERIAAGVEGIKKVNNHLQVRK